MKFKKYIYSILMLTLIIYKPCNIIAQQVSSKNGMVVSASGLASQVGANILKDGGNAIDAAVAVGFALAVTYPYAGNLGGGGFMVIHFSLGKNTSVDFREKAPKNANSKMYLDSSGNFIPELSQKGTTSAGVPGSVAGLIYCLEKYGSMPLEKVIQPAIDLAMNGWILDAYSAKSIANNLDEFKMYPSSYKVFSDDGIPFEEGDLFVQKDLGWTLEQIKMKGVNGFYDGKVAELIVKQIKELNGIITLDDLKNYKAVERKPVTGTYRGHKIISMPPPSSGGIALIEMLNVLENFEFQLFDWNSSGYINKLVETMKYAYADRTYHLGDEDFYPVPKEKLLSKEYARTIFNQLTPYAKPSEEIKSLCSSNIIESEETTHYSVYDSEGNAVSVTTTINSGYGSKIIVEGTGFLLNNEMDDFSAKPGEPNQFGLLGSVANSIEPEKRMLSSMTPTIVLKDEKPIIITGSPGGSTIITVVLQVIMNCIDFGMNIQEAVNAPRIHHQWLPDKIYLEKFAANNDVVENLIKMGYELANRNKTFRILGSAQSIMIDQQNKIIYGAADPRRVGEAVGY